MTSTVHAADPAHVPAPVENPNKKLTEDMMQLCDSSRVDTRISEAEWETKLQGCFKKYLTVASPLMRLTQDQVGPICPKYSELNEAKRLEFLQALPHVYSLSEWAQPLNKRALGAYAVYLRSENAKPSPGGSGRINDSVNYRWPWRENQFGILGEALSQIRYAEFRFAPEGKSREGTLTTFMMRRFRELRLQRNVLPAFRKLFPACF